jgi:hypothetical protein
MWKILRLLLLALLALAVLAAGALAALYVWWQVQPKTFDECMIVEMKGVDTALLPNVQAVCERRFRVQIQKTPARGEWTWDAGDGKVSVMLLSPFSIQYEPIKADAQISDQACETAAPGSFRRIELYYYDGWLRGIDETGKAVCMTLDNVWVTRK